jgi:hypothetical protein
VRWSSSFPTIFAFAQQRGARLPHCPVPGFLTGPRFDASPAFAFAPARRFARLSTRPIPFEVAETFTPELSPPQVTPRRSRVSLRSCLDPCCGGTCARWDSAVMGCNFASEAFPKDTAPKYLLRDRDAIYSEVFTRCVARLGIPPVTTAPRAPWQNPFGQRVSGSLRREGWDHCMILSETHLRRLWPRDVAYSNAGRPHQALDNHSLRPREVHPPALGRVVATPPGWRAPSPLPARGLIPVGRPAHVRSLASLARPRWCVLASGKVGPANLLIAVAPDAHSSCPPSRVRGAERSADQIFDQDKSSSARRSGGCEATDC